MPRNTQRGPSLTNTPKGPESYAEPWVTMPPKIITPCLLFKSTSCQKEEKERGVLCEAVAYTSSDVEQRMCA